MSDSQFINIKSQSVPDLQTRIDESAKKGYRPVCNIFVIGDDLNLQMGLGKPIGSDKPFLIGSGRRIEELTHWMNLSHADGYNPMGYEPVEFAGFMHILATHKKVPRR